MEKLISSSKIALQKSTFTIDLLRHETGWKYLTIDQYIKVKNKNIHQGTFKINPDALRQLLKILNKYLPEVEQADPLYEKILNKELKSISTNARRIIVSRYLRGVSVNDLTMMYECHKEVIYHIVKLAGIPVDEIEVTVEDEPENKPPPKKPLKEKAIDKQRRWLL